MYLHDGNRWVPREVCAIFFNHVESRGGRVF